MDLLENLSDTTNRWVERSLFWLGFTMALIVATQVFFRYALNHSLFWSEELARYLLVWLTFLGASAAYRRGAHPGIDLLYVRLPPPLKKAAALLSHLAALSLFAIMIYYGCQFAYFVRLQISPALAIPKWIIFSIVPLAGSILFLHGVNFLAGVLRENPNDG